MARKPTVKQLVDASPIVFLEQELIDLRTWLGTSESKRNAAAYVAGIRAAAELHGQLDALRNPTAAVGPDPTKDMTDEEVVAATAEGLRGLPLAMLDDILELVGAERVVRTPDLRVVEGGQ
jgi:hypothetical protein